jgi:diguanylate cyclase (GGDEF)-like protein
MSETDAEVLDAITRLARIAGQVVRTPVVAVYLLRDGEATLAAHVGAVVPAHKPTAARLELSRPRASTSTNAPELSLFTTRLPLRWCATFPLGAAGAQRGALVVADMNPRGDAEGMHEQLRDVRFLLEEAIDQSDDIRARELPGARRPPPAAGRGGHDSITGLPLRGFAIAECERLIARSEVLGGGFTVFHVELDRFRRINEGMGPAAADALLRQVAERLREVVGDGGLVTRRGGDEFLVISNDSDRSSAMLAHALRGTLQEPFHYQGSELTITASLGYAGYPSHASDAPTLLRCAEIALALAKERGGARALEFDASMESAARDRAELERDLRNALRDQLLTLYYQPKHRIRDRRVSGSEALVRWTDPRHGPISPLRFIPIAEETGLIVPLGAWCLGEACRQRRKWADDGLDPGPVSVNVSAVQFGRVDFVASVRRAIRDTRIEPRWLELEITESAVMDDVDTAVRRLSELRELGVRISVDDFGTGYSSLGYLTRLPLDVLKIDRTFVRDLDADGPIRKQANAIARTVSYLGKALGLEVLAEGVETEAQLAMLSASECDAVQGFLFAKPLPAADAERYFRSKA